MRDYSTFKKAATMYFSPIVAEEDNSAILGRTLALPNLTSKVVEILEREEHADHWPLHDRDLKKYIRLSCQTESIPFPTKKREVKRWFSLLYLTASQKEEFDCDNMVRFCDVTGKKDTSSNL